MNDDRGAREHELFRTQWGGGTGRPGAHRRRPPPDFGPDQDGRGPGEPPGQPRPARRRRKPRAWWVELPVLLAFALILALLIKSFLVQAFFIPSSSMEDTLDIGDKVLVNKLVYDVRSIHRGDIIVFNGEGSWNTTAALSPPLLTRFWDSITGLFGTAPGVHDYIKRVIGVPGDHVACCDKHGQLTVNGVPLSERSYLFPGDSPSETHFRITVPPGHLWVMGDHRSVSYDSRGHVGDPGGGSIPEDKVVGRAFTIVWPPSRWRILPIPPTFKQPRLSAALGHAPAGSPGGGGLAAGHEPATSIPAAATIGVRPAGPLAPLGLSFGIAIPLTWLQRRLRRPAGRRVRAIARRLAGRGGGPSPPGHW